MQLTLDFLPGINALFDRHGQVGQQPDNLCGPYWVSMLLQTYGKYPVSAVDVAQAAATVLPSQGNPSDWIPSGATSRQENGYNSIPTVSNIDECGTSVAGLIEATENLSQGLFSLLPIQPDLQLECQAEHWKSALDTLVQICQAHSPWGAVPLLNSHTSYFWNSRLTPADVTQFLQTGRAPATNPDWAVGHFALLVGHLQGHAHRLYAILDTYPQFGWNGLHLQPPSAIAQSLLRPHQSTQGGILLFIKSKDKSHIQQVMEQRGFHIAVWNNGTPFCP